jgi:hypothetical protein
MPQCSKDYGKNKEANTKTYKNVKNFLLCTVKTMISKTLTQVNNISALFKQKTS